jgi:rhamnose transport system permease protein
MAPRLTARRARENQPMLDAVRRLPRREASVLLLVVLLALVASVFDPGFLSPANLRDILVRAAPTAIICCGVMLVVVTGEIDISVGSLTALLAAFLGLALSRDHGGWPCWIALPLLLAAGSLVGWLTGLLVTVGRVPSIMATLGLITALRGTTTLVMRGGNIQGLPEGLTAWSKHGLFGLIHRTALGRRLYALGSSPESAEMAGLPVGRLKRFAFAYTGFLVALATIVEIPRLPQIEAGIGSELELLVVTCVVVGGVAIRGGRGTLTGVMLAVLLMTMIRPVLTFLAVGESGEKWAKAIQGLLILVAVVADSWMTRRDPRGNA